MCEQKPYIADMVLVLAQKLSDIVWTQPAKTDTKEDNARLKKKVISAFHILCDLQTKIYLVKYKK